MGGVLGTIASDHLVVTRVASQRKRSLEDMITRLHQHQNTLDLLLTLLHGQPRALTDILDQLLFDDLAGTMEKVLHHVEEFRIRRRGHVLQPIRDLVVGVATGVGLHGSRQDARQHAPQNIAARRLLQGDRRTRKTPHVKHLRAMDKCNDDNEEMENDDGDRHDDSHNVRLGDPSDHNDTNSTRSVGRLRPITRNSSRWR